jgi:hypothetical protein
LRDSRNGFQPATCITHSRVIDTQHGRDLSIGLGLPPPFPSRTAAARAAICVLRPDVIRLAVLQM